MVISRTPLRVSLVGGGSDLPWFSREHGGAVVTTAINKYVHVIVTPRFEHNLRVSYSKTEIVDNLAELEHDLVREALRLAGLRRKLEIVTLADVPAKGTGLGSSSAVVIGLLNALFAYQGVLKSSTELAEMAAHIEIDVLSAPIGRQDHYASAHGGLQFLRFGPDDRVQRHPVIAPDAVRRGLERNLLMFYTGQQRSASSILEEIRDTRKKGRQEDRHLAGLRDQAVELFGRLSRGGDPSYVGEHLHRSWQLKRELHPRVSSPEIDSWYSAARENGAIGGKLLGAGGGGFLLFYVPAERQTAVRQALTDLQELPFRFEPEGSRIVFVDQ
jgi:D-glycero-alpha-D-manno-heptose-7-phosphate kinase